MDLKNYQNFTLSNLCYLLPIKKFWTQTTIRPSIWLQVLSDPSQLYDSSPEIYRFVSTYVTKCAKPPQFFPQPTYMILWHLTKSHNFSTLFSIFKFFKKFRNGLFAECPPLGTRQTSLFQVPTSRHSANNLVCRVFFRWYLANRLFAKCPK